MSSLLRRENSSELVKAVSFTKEAIQTEKDIVSKAANSSLCIVQVFVSKDQLAIFAAACIYELSFTFVGTVDVIARRRYDDEAIAFGRQVIHNQQVTISASGHFLFRSDTIRPRTFGKDWN